MKMIPVAALIIVMIFAPQAFAQDDIRVLRLARFESEDDYQRYADWIADLENVRFAVIANGKRWTSAVETWAKEYLQEPANVESNDDIFLITYAEGGLDTNTASSTLELIAMAYNERLTRRLHREEELQRAKLEAEYEEMQRMAGENGQDEERLQAELQDVQQQQLKAKLQAAQAEARSRALLEFERKGAATSAGRPSDTRVHELRKELALRKLEAAEKSLKNVAQLNANGRSPEADVAQAEVALVEAKMELAAFEEEASRGDDATMERSLRPMLIEAEAERASALALEAVLKEQEDRLRAKIDKQRALSERKRALDKERAQIDPRKAPTTSRRGFTTGGPVLIHPES